MCYLSTSEDPPLQYRPGMNIGKSRQGIKVLGVQASCFRMTYTCWVLPVKVAVVWRVVQLGELAQCIGKVLMLYHHLVVWS